MEKVKHIKNITVENFKCFEHFSAGDFGMYNIILGDNNVGKTSFLESLLFDENITQTISNLKDCLLYKGLVSKTEKLKKINPITFFKNRYFNDESIVVDFTFFNNVDVNLKLKTVFVNDLDVETRSALNSHFNNINLDNEIVEAEVNGELLFRSHDINLNYEYTSVRPFVFSSNFYADDLVMFYSKHFSASIEMKKIMISSLQNIIPSLSNIEITLNDTTEPLIGIWLQNKDALLPLPLFGDGTIRLFRMIMEIVMSKNSYLCIDEIDTGIHYSRYKDFCKIVLQTAKANNVQLFISTHNNEFLKSLKEVLEEKDFIDYQKDTKSFTLKKLPDERIKAYEYSFEQFEFAIEQENELR
nr:AAA family ATPase [uncultured Flavobacterium sp.]